MSVWCALAFLTDLHNPTILDLGVTCDFEIQLT